MPSSTSASLIGRAPDSLTLAERLRLAGKWIALPIYTPQTLPLRAISAIGASSAECMADLSARGLDPTAFEFERFR